MGAVVRSSGGLPWHEWLHRYPLLASPLALAVLGLVALVGLAAVVVRLVRPDLPYVAAPSLLTPAERAFFAVLRQALGEDYHLFAKVRLGDILEVQRGVSGKRRFAAFGRISSKHADFVACDPGTFAVRGVIELDDRSHLQRHRQERDQFFDAALAVADIPVLRVTVQRTYSPKDLREQAWAAFGPPARPGRRT